LRLAGLPRSPRELDLGLRLWAAHRRLGWFASGAGGARSASGEPLPWWTYGALLWLDGHLAAAPRPGAACLELGAGSSTLWLARRFERVVSLEHDERWVRRLSARVPANVELRLVDAADEAGYLAAFDERAGGWDLVVIDGLHRTAALARAVEGLAGDGLVLLDDSDRPQYAEAIRAVHRRGLSRIDFHGFAPAVAHLRCTSIFGPPGLATRAEAPAWFGHSLRSYRDL
ncbi:MAG TPA: class I SAM-dependent methyltransferase, partial [Thermoanaerobaculia bacterium]|nr:class I SAM-dependent methyltransferase [Thermoanaerobaculia bacterium]